MPGRWESPRNGGERCGNQALDFSEIEKTQELEMDFVEKSERKSRSPSLDSFLRIFWALGPVKDTIFWLDTQGLKADSFSGSVNLYYQLCYFYSAHLRCFISCTASVHSLVAQPLTVFIHRSLWDKHCTAMNLMRSGLSWTCINKHDKPIPKHSINGCKWLVYHPQAASMSRLADL